MCPDLWMLGVYLAYLSVLFPRYLVDPLVQLPAAGCLADLPDQLPAGACLGDPPVQLFAVAFLMNYPD